MREWRPCEKSSERARQTSEQEQRGGFLKVKAVHFVSRSGLWYCAPSLPFLLGGIALLALAVPSSKIVQDRIAEKSATQQKFLLLNSIL
jgi:hypothetical protein